MPVQCTCFICGKSFGREPGRVKVRNYCSQVCKKTPPPITLTADGLDGLIPLRAKDGSIRAYTVVDAADAEWAGQWRWSLSANGYACRGTSVGSRKLGIRLHRELLGLPRVYDGREGDHIDLDRLNNRRGNLRIVAKGQQAQNQPSHAGSSSQYRGVSWNRRDRRWRAAVTVNGKMIRLGRFTDELEAAQAARSARLKLLPYATG